MRPPKTSRISLTLAALLAAGSSGSMGFNFEADGRSIFRALPAAPAVGQPPPVKPLAVQPITDGTDAASRTRSWFNAVTGKLCLGNEINKTCR
jgi:hypothetical protein